MFKKLCCCGNFFPIVYDVYLCAYKCSCGGWKGEESIENMPQSKYMRLGQYVCGSSRAKLMQQQNIQIQQQLYNCYSNFIAPTEFFKLLNKNRSLREELQDEIDDWLKEIL